MHPSLVDFEELRPKHEIHQACVLEWIAKAHTQSQSSSQNWSYHSQEAKAFYESIKERLFKLGLGPEKVQKRGCVFDDFFHEDWDNMSIFKLSHSKEGFHLKERMEIFEKVVDNVFETFYKQDVSLPHHLIHVTCTGYVSPSGAQKIVSKRHATAHTIVTHAYHMGCYASLPAIRMGVGFLASSENHHAKTDIVHSELCSLHMNPSIHDTDQLVIQSLFGDGFIKYSLVNGCHEKKPKLTLIALHEETIPESTDSMIWKCAHWGFHMHIGKEVPVLIHRHLHQFLIALLKKTNLEWEAIKDRSILAIHPGGPKIIEQIATLLQLKEEQYLHSKAILSSYGNMSSATLPHIWQSILKDPHVTDDTLVISVAFGPGLSISGAVFQKRGAL